MAGSDLNVVLGTMTFGWAQASAEVDDEAARAQMELFTSRGHREVDTALMYAGGETEKILGRVLRAHPELNAKVAIATKAKPWPTGASGGGGLAPDRLAAQTETSLKSLQLPAVDILYLHAPDTETPVEATLEAANELHRQGKFRTLGLSNYQAWEVAHIYHLCKSRGWVTPSVYQGMYNAMTRAVEQELLPCLRTLGIRFLCYNPLAAGVLTGKHAKDPASAPAQGRFKNNKMYMDRFWKSTYLALDGVQAACDQGGTAMTAAALRWLKHHSALRSGDGVILGASQIAHLEQNLDALEGGPLPEAIVAAMDAHWEACRPDCPAYERGHSKIPEVAAP